jgi:hypothetical protein
MVFSTKGFENGMQNGPRANCHQTARKELQFSIETSYKMGYALMSKWHMTQWPSCHYSVLKDTA